MFSLLITSRAARQLRGIRQPHRARCLTAIERLASNPRPQGCRKLAGRQSDWRIRVGSYRILYRIDGDQLVVTVIRVADRKDAYR